MADDLKPDAWSGRAACIAAVLLSVALSLATLRTASAETPSVDRSIAAHAPLPPPTCHGKRRLAERGVASWYGDELHGQPTASGEPFDSDRLTAAHRSLPLGSSIRVTNLDNGRSVRLTVNDRGPFVEDRLIDVSQGAARKLGFEGQGLARVRLEYQRDC